MAEVERLGVLTTDAQVSTEKWTTRDAYLANFPQEDRTYVYCDHCRSTLVVRPFLFDGQLYMECQVCRFTYQHDGVIKEDAGSIPGQ